MITQSGLRPKIVFVGHVNVGKSSLINAILGEKSSIVSAIKGTTTDSLARAYELLGYGAVSICDTAGFGDDTPLGQARMAESLKTLQTANVAVLVLDSAEMGEKEADLFKKIERLKIPFLLVYNKADINTYDENVLKVDSLSGAGVESVREALKAILKKGDEKSLLSGLVKAGDSVLLVMPQDSSAPKGRLILPQVQMIRELLDIGAISTNVQTNDMALALKKASYDLIITDSKVIKEVLSQVPDTQKVSTFSILFARAKGDFDIFLKGAEKIDFLQENDTILISESCVHTTNEDDIAKEMLPRILQKYTGKKLKFSYISGKKLPESLENIALILQCGGCMLTPKEMQARITLAKSHTIPITNYGITITKCTTQNIHRLTF